MDLDLQREVSVRLTTFGKLYVGGVFECYTLEDMVREVAGEPVAKWKIKHETAIPAGRYPLTMETSPRFGPDTLTINHVPGFDGVRMHGGLDKDSTDGCPTVGDVIDRNNMTIHGAKLRGVLDKLKRRVFIALQQGPVFINIKNAEA